MICYNILVLKNQEGCIMEEIDLKEIFELVKSKYKLIVIVVLGVCILGSLYSLLLQKPMYQSYTTVILGSAEGTTSSTITSYQ